MLNAFDVDVSLSSSSSISLSPSLLLEEENTISASTSPVFSNLCVSIASSVSKPFTNSLNIGNHFVLKHPLSSCKHVSEHLSSRHSFTPSSSKILPVSNISAAVAVLFFSRSLGSSLDSVTICSNARSFQPIPTILGTLKLIFFTSAFSLRLSAHKKFTYALSTISEVSSVIGVNVNCHPLPFNEDEVSPPPSSSDDPNCPIGFHPAPIEKLLYNTSWFFSSGTSAFGKHIKATNAVGTSSSNKEQHHKPLLFRV
mmetsp:Transcript_520/g.1865  ORF Transcript_520/g.1865 Transcript_520/m.1865 type:complete len:255 (+) Transcript_520:5309-6073(+)